jgi:4a-hydroxytetrahydrobiopterin dehydratase
MSGEPVRLEELHCQACRPGSPPASPTELAQFHQDYPGWVIVETDPGTPILECVFKFKDYRGALAFTNKIAELAELEDHHPALLLEWGKVTVRWWTHAIQGLHLNDLIMAARTDQAYHTHSIF